MRPTGRLHLGNFVGALSQWVALQRQYECYFMVADWHALTTDYQDTKSMQENIREMVLDWLAAGIDPEKSVIMVQSLVPEHAELHLLLSMIVPLPWLERVPTYKEQIQQLKAGDNAAEAATWGAMKDHMYVIADALAGRAAPYATYHWFFPTGTVAAVSGRWNDQVRLQLSRASVAWVDAVDLHPLPAGTPVPGGSTGGSVRAFSDEHAVTLRIPLATRVPFRVDEGERWLTLVLYGTAADLDFVQYGPEDPLVDRLTFAQPREDETEIRVDLGLPVWGYRTRWSGSDLLLVIRRPPRIDPAHPLRGRRIAVDPGHPPLGAVGPTGAREPDVTLAVGRKVQELLERAGAAAIMLRNSDAPVELAPRVVAAERADADVLVSIHANALPDGVNPFVNNGTSVYYFQPRSLALARALDRALVRRLGFRDLGVGRADLALARPTWMPAALCEGLFMMLPDQEAVLTSEDGQWRYARGIVEGLEEFLRGRAMR